ncbi:MAG: alanine racemase [Chloroflexota bacterium]|nr:alanine racemase [Chloroflexota bacterium]
MTGPAARPPIEDRLAAAGLPPLPRTAWLEIDLDALTANLRLLGGLAGPGVPLRPVVKADAYGHGAIPVARALEAAGADGFCVAAIDEALDLRANGIQAPILVLYPVPATWATEAARQRIGVTAGDPFLLGETLAATSTEGGSDRPLELELEVETGLGRGGFSGPDAVEAARRIAGAPGVRLAGLWTHLQAVEDPGQTAVQIARFEAAVEAIGRTGIELPPRHVAASAALIVDGVAAYDGVRPGLALYGLPPDELDAGSIPSAVSEGLRPVMALLARPVRVADLPAGWGISYGPTFRTARPSRIATLPVGYGDGWSRRLSNRASAIVRGQRVPLVGNVAMDAVMADVTDVPGPAVTVDDEFTLLGGSGEVRISAAELAQQRTTNSWEVVSSMARRVPRVYHAAAGPVDLRTLIERRD